GSQDRRRRDEDGEGQRSQVRRLPLHRHPRQGTARDRARVPLRRRQVQRRSRI
ncbi:MAG: Glutamine synthetase type I, partial [uncultured Ramlibacter sp.]